MSLIKEIQKDLINKNYFEQFEKDFINYLVNKYGHDSIDKMIDNYESFVEHTFENTFNIQRNKKFKVIFEKESDNSQKSIHYYDNYYFMMVEIEHNDISEVIIRLGKYLDPQQKISSHLYFNKYNKFVAYDEDSDQWNVKDIIQIE